MPLVAKHFARLRRELVLKPQKGRMLAWDSNAEVFPRLAASAAIAYEILQLGFFGCLL